MNKLIALLSLLALPLTAFCQNQASGSSPTPQQLIAATLGEVVKVNESYPGEELGKERRAKLRQVINPRFDFHEMSQRSLGSNWAGHPPEQQKEFVDLFSDLMAKTYLSKVEQCARDTVKVEKDEVDGIKAMVKTTVIYKGETFPLDYRLLLKDGQWRVYDVIVENIGLVANYRNEFAGIIRKDGFEGLLKQLREKSGK